jgi:hypothetical protein
MPDLVGVPGEPPNLSSLENDPYLLPSIPLPRPPVPKPMPYLELSLAVVVSILLPMRLPSFSAARRAVQLLED